MHHFRELEPTFWELFSKFASIRERIEALEALPNCITLGKLITSLREELKVLYKAIAEYHLFIIIFLTFISSQSVSEDEESDDIDVDLVQAATIVTKSISVASVDNHSNPNQNQECSNSSSATSQDFPPEPIPQQNEQTLPILSNTVEEPVVPSEEPATSETPEISRVTSSPLTLSKENLRTRSLRSSLSSPHDRVMSAPDNLNENHEKEKDGPQSESSPHPTLPPIKKRRDYYSGGDPSPKTGQLTRKGSLRMHKRSDSSGNKHLFSFTVLSLRFFFQQNVVVICLFSYLRVSSYARPRFDAQTRLPDKTRWNQVQPHEEALVCLPGSLSGVLEISRGMKSL